MHFQVLVTACFWSDFVILIHLGSSNSVLEYFVLIQSWEKKWSSSVSILARCSHNFCKHLGVVNQWMEDSLSCFLFNKWVLKICFYLDFSFVLVTSQCHGIASSFCTSLIRLQKSHHYIVIPGPFNCDIFIMAMTA